MLSSIRYFLADLGHWLGRHWALAGGAIALVAALGVGVYLLASGGEDDVANPAPERADELGFPAFATKNTTRIGSPSPPATAAATRWRSRIRDPDR